MTQFLQPRNCKEKKRERVGKGTYLLKTLKEHQLVAMYRLYSDPELNNLKKTHKSKHHGKIREI